VQQNIIRFYSNFSVYQGESLKWLFAVQIVTLGASDVK